MILVMHVSNTRMENSKQRPNFCFWFCWLRLEFFSFMQAKLYNVFCRMIQRKLFYQSVMIHLFCPELHYMWKKVVLMEIATLYQLLSMKLDLTIKIYRNLGKSFCFMSSFLRKQLLRQIFRHYVFFLNEAKTAKIQKISSKLLFELKFLKFFVTFQLFIVFDFSQKENDLPHLW